MKRIIKFMCADIVEERKTVRKRSEKSQKKVFFCVSSNRWKFTQKVIESEWIANKANKEKEELSF